MLHLRRNVVNTLIAWSYITFTGRYNFKSSSSKINLQETISALEAKIRTTLWKEG